MKIIRSFCFGIKISIALFLKIFPLRRETGEEEKGLGK